MSSRGHRVLPHTADVIVEAWGPDVPACIEEAVAGLISLCVDPGGAPATDTEPANLQGDSAEAILLAALDEVIFAIDTSPDVPVGARARWRDEGTLDLVLRVAARRDVEETGAGPKAISRSDLSVVATPGHVSCSFLVDV